MTKRMPTNKAASMPAEPAAPRLLWITERYAPSRGGMAVSCDRIVHALRKRDMWVDLVHLSRSCVDATFQPRECGSDRVLPAGPQAAHSLAALWPQLSETDAAWSHVVAFGGALPCAAASAYAAWLGIPLVVLFRGNDFDTGVFWPDRRAALEDAVRRAALVGCVTEDQCRRVQRLFPGAHAVWTPNGIDREEWQALPSDRSRASAWRAGNVAAGRKVIGLFGDLKAKKGAELLIEAIEAGQLSASVHLLIAGTPPESFELRLPPDLGVSILPAMPRTGLIPYLLACDAVALPSLYEGFPNLLLEAAALGVPLLASEAGGAGVLRDGVHGTLFRTANANACRRALERFVSAPPETLVAWSTACVALADEYSQVREAERYLRLLDEGSGTRGDARSGLHGADVTRLPVKSGGT